MVSLVPPPGSCAIHCGSSSCQTNTTTSSPPRSEHGRIPQHVWDNEKPHVAASNVDLIEMRYSAVTRSGGDVFKLNVHIVLGYEEVNVSASVTESGVLQVGGGSMVLGNTIFFIPSRSFPRYT